MKYFAIIRIQGERGLDVWKGKGGAEKTLAKALNYINHKEDDNSLKRFIQFLKKDFKDFENMLSEDLCKLMKK